MTRDAERGTLALPAALAVLAVSAVLAAAIAELAGTEVVIARHRRAAAAALAADDACLAAALAAVPPGWDFDALLAGPDGTAGSADDGTLATPAGCAGSARAAPGAADPPRALFRAEARVGEGRRALDAAVGRTTAPGIPALLWFSAPPPSGAITGSVVLDGADVADAAADWASLAAPADPAALDGWMAAEGPHVVASGRTAPAITAAAPPLQELGARVRSAAPAGTGALVSAGTPPATVIYVDGDLVVTGGLSGAGLLFVGGMLDIRGSLDFTGLVVASGGVRVASSGSLAIAGGLWLGTPAPPGSALAVDGTIGLRQQRAAIEDVDRRLRLPRRPALLGLRDLG